MRRNRSSADTNHQAILEVSFAFCSAVSQTCWCEPVTNWASSCSTERLTCATWLWKVCVLWPAPNFPMKPSRHTSRPWSTPSRWYLTLWTNDGHSANIRLKQCFDCFSCSVLVLQHKQLQVVLLSFCLKGPKLVSSTWQSSHSSALCYCLSFCVSADWEGCECSTEGSGSAVCHVWSQQCQADRSRDAQLSWDSRLLHQRGDGGCAKKYLEPCYIFFFSTFFCD